MWFGHGKDKYGGLNGSFEGGSSGALWRNVELELRRHRPGRREDFTPSSLEIAVVLEGSSAVNRRADGVEQVGLTEPGAIWLCPPGVTEDFLMISDGTPKVIHLYLAESAFHIPELSGSGAERTYMSVDYSAAVQDPLIEQISHAMLAEALSETSAGRILVETLTTALAMRIAKGHSHSRASTDKVPGGLDSRRLRRTLDYIEMHLEDDLSLEKMANAANLSKFHFARAFKNSLGVSPHQYVSQRRLARAKDLIREGRRSLADIALSLSFSSQASFTRAFRRATNLTPGAFSQRRLISSAASRAQNGAKAQDRKDWDDPPDVDRSCPSDTCAQTP